MVAGYVLLSWSSSSRSMKGCGSGCVSVTSPRFSVSVPVAFSPVAGAIMASLGAMQAWGWSALRGLRAVRWAIRPAGPLRGP